MPVLYIIYDITDCHWLSLYSRVMSSYTANFNNEFEVDEYVDRLNQALSMVRGIIVKTRNGEEHPLWVKGIEFEREEDLLAFKLTFN